MPVNKARTYFRAPRALTLVEATAGFIIIIPIALAAFDLLALISANELNEQWAESACRVAATKVDELAAEEAARKSLAGFKANAVALEISLKSFNFDTSLGQVSLSTELSVKMPVPIPVVGDVHLKTSATHPIVGIPAPN